MPSRPIQSPISLTICETRIAEGPAVRATAPARCTRVSTTRLPLLATTAPPGVGLSCPRWGWTHSPLTYRQEVGISAGDRISGSCHPPRSPSGDYRLPGFGLFLGVHGVHARPDAASVGRTRPVGSARPPRRRRRRPAAAGDPARTPCPQPTMRVAQPVEESAPVLEPTSTIGKAVTFWVCTSVIASNSSSMVPKPPGSTMKPLAYLTNIVLRAKK